MSKREKLLVRFRNNPKTVRFEEIDTLLLRLGFEKRQSGSHATYTLENHLLTIPFRKPYILPIYVKSIVTIQPETRFFLSWDRIFNFKNRVSSRSLNSYKVFWLF